MNLQDLANIVPVTHNSVVNFAGRITDHGGPPNDSPLDIFIGPFTGGVWLDTVEDAETLAALIRMAIGVSFALDPNDPLAAMRLIPNLIGPDAFGGSEKLAKLNSWLKQINPSNSTSNASNP